MLAIQLVRYLYNSSYRTAQNVSRLDTVDQIWEIQPTLEDKYLGARYAGISLFWTYDRMTQEQRYAHAKRNRAFNISKGHAAQLALYRELSTRGVDVTLEEKSHRVTDSYDLRFPDHPEFDDLDLKTFNHFTNYGVDEKPPLTPELIADNFAYDGPEWGHFFPLLVPYDQFTHAKDAYCFGITSSIDYRSRITGRDGYELYAFPNTDERIGQFLVTGIESREQADTGFSLSVRFTSQDAPVGHKLKIIGEWDGRIKEQWVPIGDQQEPFGTLAGVNSFKIRKQTYQLLEQTDTAIAIEVVGSDSGLSETDARLTVSAADFHNLLMPTEFNLYVLGWIPKAAFQTRALNHPGWTNPSQTEFTRNQHWNSISATDKRLFASNNVDWTLTDEQTVRGAVRKNSGCYYYPKINRQNIDNGGLQKTNLYVVPADLRLLDELR